MAKFVFVVVLALIALQGSSAASLKFEKENNKDLLNEIKQTLAEAKTRGYKLSKDTDNKFAEIEKTADFDGLFDGLKKDAIKMLEEGGPGAKNCQSYTYRNIMMLEKSTSIFHCRIIVDDDVIGWRADFLDSVDEMQDVLNKVNKQVILCKAQSENEEEMSKCMEDKVEPLRQEFDVVNKNLQEILNKLENNMPMFNQKMFDCVEANRLGLVRNIRLLLNNVQDCVEANSA